MKTFYINTFSQSRVIGGSVLFCLLVVCTIVLKTLFTFPSFYIPLVIILGLIALYYFIRSKVKITLNDDVITFERQKKLMFNQKSIPKINVSEIRTIVIDEEIMLKKIITNDKVLRLQTVKVLRADVNALISELYKLKEGNKVRFITSWQEYKENGYFKLAFKVSLGITLATFVVVSIIFVLYGYSSSYLSLLVITIFPAAIYFKQR